MVIGIGIPFLVAGPLCKSQLPSALGRNEWIYISDYVVQVHRFAELEDIGCYGVESSSILSILLVDSWYIVIPLVSAVFYCRKFPSFMTPV